MAGSTILSAVLALVILPALVAQEGEQVWTDDIDQALREAEATRRPVFVYVYDSV